MAETSALNSLAVHVGKSLPVKKMHVVKNVEVGTDM